MNKTDLTLDEVLLLLAERLPELRRDLGYEQECDLPSCDCHGRGWVPDVTLEGLLVAMGERRIRFQIAIFVPADASKPFAFFAGQPSDSLPERRPTPLEAAARAALAALESA